MSEYLPGPWEIDESVLRTQIIIHRKGLTICRVPKRTPHAIETARLIAAAPKLLEALKLLKSDCEMALSGNWDRSDEGFVAMLEMAEAAIAETEEKETAE